MIDENITKEEIVIAAWLHDVGKFAQRAEVQELYSRQLEGRYCKTTKDGRFTHQHVVYTEGFLSRYKDVLPDNVNFEHIKTLAASHHNPSSYYDWIISQADCLSSGSDRCNILGIAECENENQFDEEKEKLKFYEKPMIHILSTLRLDGRSEPKKAFCKMSELAEDSVLPVENYKISKEEYKTLWSKFIKDFQKLQGLKYDEFLLSLNSLLERYLWCIPSATNSDADISLYQHAKTTAAFAAALYEYHKEEKSENELALKTDGKKFLLINGDISGIQNYIFDLKTSSDNAKLLRAKSFQLWALSEIISQYITKQFGVTYANIMTCRRKIYRSFAEYTKSKKTAG
ncbi:MAG: type III-A CRISPR-associated protein Cas10/Csm1 [Spirochaetales bacterium]|nr:type III-A CRISPR-associated protein Cas10/Csm1 [Spirochaetales bacterium]